MPAPSPAALLRLEELLAAAGGAARHRLLGWVDDGGERLPLHAILLGNPDPGLPALGFFGGVHGLERIGAEAVIAYLHSLVARLGWDRGLQHQLDHLQLVFMPLVNPGGLRRGTRANPRGVDLMRNAPVEAQGPVPFLVGGQRFSPGLPWYRGAAGAAMEVESAALCELVEAELLSRPFALALDCHSGFGSRDRLWFPHAHTPEPMAPLPEVHALGRILAESHPHHRYVLEPQSRQYLAHGDLWDHLLLRAAGQPPGSFLPLTLEMGSWLWVRKNPRQLFRRDGLFNPMIAHRQQRVLRRHLGLFDFLARATQSHAAWCPQGAAREQERALALARWYAA